MADWFDENSPPQATQPQQDWFAQNAPPVATQERSIPSKIGHAVLDTVKGFIPSSVEDAALAPITMFPGVGQAYKSLANIAFGRPASEGVSPVAGIPVVQRIPEIIAAEKTPALSQERFTTGAGVVADLAMLAGFKGALKPEIAARPSLAEVAGIAKPEVPPETVTPEPITPVATDAVSQPVPEVAPSVPASESVVTAPLSPEIPYLGKVEPVAPDLPTGTGEELSRIKEAAIRLPDGRIVGGRTHPYITSRLSPEDLAAWVKQPREENVGFVTESGEYLNREEALQRAIATKDATQSQLDDIKAREAPYGKPVEQLHASMLETARYKPSSPVSEAPVSTTAPTFTDYLRDISEGRPVTLYHGSSKSGLTELSPRVSFTHSRPLAERISKAEGQPGQVYEVKASVPENNPLRWSAESTLRDIESGKITESEAEKLFNQRVSEVKFPENERPFTVSSNKTPVAQTTAEGTGEGITQSKVVDSEGKPLVVYHGTGGELPETFRTQSPTLHDTPGAYFTNDKGYASSFGTIRSGKYGGGNVGEYTLDIRNPADRVAETDAQYIVDDQTQRVKRGVTHRLDDGRLALLKPRTGAEVRQRLEAQGYDGVYRKMAHGADEWIAFHPEQVKPLQPTSVSVEGQAPTASVKPKEVAGSGIQKEVSTPTGGIENASKITKSESTTVPEVRQEMGGEASLRQQGTTAEARQEVQPTAAPQEQVAPPTEPTETGISNQRLVEAYGDSAPVTNTGKGAGAWKDEGLSRLGDFQKTGDVNNDPYSVLTNLRKGQTTVSLPSDVSLLRAEHQRLLEDARNAEGTPEYADKSKAALDMATAIKDVAHGPASDVFRALQEYDKPRYDNVTDFDQALREREKRESTPEEKASFKKMSKDVTETRDSAAKEIDTAQKKLNKFPKMDFMDAAKNIHDQITKLTKDCVL